MDGSARERARRIVEQLLELRRLVKHYQVGKKALPICAVDGVSLSVQRGEFVALYGPSGSGKTTLLNLVAGLQDPESGEIVFDGRVITALSEGQRDEWRLHEVGVIGQPNRLIRGMRAVDSASIKLWLAGETRSRSAVPLLEQLGLGERLHHKTEQLSMGERQRVMIAQALMLDPKLVLADEPTGSLDTRLSREVLLLMRDLCREREATVLLVTHDPEAAKIADLAYELRDGQLTEFDPVEHSLFEHDG